MRPASRLREFWEALTIFFRRFRVTRLAARRRRAARAKALRWARPARSSCWRWPCPPSRRPPATGARRTISPSPSSTATATRSASAASSSAIPCRSTRCPTMSSRRCWPPRTAASSSISASTSSAWSRAMSENVRANSVVQGGSSITQQLAKNLFLSNERTVERKIKEAFLAVWLEMQPVQEGDPAALSRPRLYGRRHVRHRGGGRFLFRQGGQGPQPRRGGDAGRPVQGAGQIRAARQPAGRARPRQRGAHQSGPGRLHDRGPGAVGAAAPGRRRRPRRAEEPRLFPRLGLRGGQAASPPSPACTRWSRAPPST